jgi:methionine synthase I (cobalamin-dependent)
MIQIAIDTGADIVGTHCGQGLEVSDYLAMARRIIAISSLPVILQPNAAEAVCPLRAGVNKTEALARAVPEYLDAGVRILGGCCGTQPDDLRAMAEAMRRWCRSRPPFELEGDSSSC